MFLFQSPEASLATAAVTPHPVDFRTELQVRPTQLPTAIHRTEVLSLPRCWTGLFHSSAPKKIFQQAKRQAQTSPTSEQCLPAQQALAEKDRSRVSFNRRKQSRSQENGGFGLEFVQFFAVKTPAMSRNAWMHPALPPTPPRSTFATYRPTVGRPHFTSLHQRPSLRHPSSVAMDRAAVIAFCTCETWKGSWAEGCRARGVQEIPGT